MQKGRDCSRPFLFHCSGLPAQRGQQLPPCFFPFFHLPRKLCVFLFSFCPLFHTAIIQTTETGGRFPLAPAACIFLSVAGYTPYFFDTALQMYSCSAPPGNIRHNFFFPASYCLYLCFRCFRGSFATSALIKPMTLLSICYSYLQNDYREHTRPVQWFLFARAGSLPHPQKTAVVLWHLWKFPSFHTPAYGAA